MRALIAGNWKMNGGKADIDRIVAPLATYAEFLDCDLLVCPPATLLAGVARALDASLVAVGAQDCAASGAAGAHTGDISAAMLRDAGAAYVILGHSERRGDHGETDDLVRAKVAAAQAAGLIPLVCVGEREAERLAGQEEAVVRAQLSESLPDGFAGVVSYEPVWAIGTGRTPAPDQVAAMHGMIRAALSARFGAAGRAMRILYGGSVKPDNAAVLLALPEVGGALVGGASLDTDAFLAIARAAPALPNRERDG